MSSALFGVGLSFMPSHLVCEASLESAAGASHDRLIVATTVDLARVASGTKTHSEVRHIAED
jgi:hypothetical protein